MQDPTSANAVELPEFGFEQNDVSVGPLVHNRRIEPAELRNVKERPRTIGSRDQRCFRHATPQEGPELRYGAAEGELSRSPINRRSFEQQTNREVTRECRGNLSCRHPVGAFFELPDHSGPPAQGQQRGGEVIGALFGWDAQLGQGMLEGGNRTAFCDPVLGHESRENPRPGPAVRSERRVVDLEETAMDAVISGRH